MDCDQNWRTSENNINAYDKSPLNSSWVLVRKLVVTGTQYITPTDYIFFNVMNTYNDNNDDDNTSNDNSNNERMNK